MNRSTARRRIGWKATLVFLLFSCIVSLAQATDSLVVPTEPINTGEAVRLSIESDRLLSDCVLQINFGDGQSQRILLNRDDGLLPRQLTKVWGKAGTYQVSAGGDPASQPGDCEFNAAVTVSVIAGVQVPVENAQASTLPTGPGSASAKIVVLDDPALYQPKATVGSPVAPILENTAIATKTVNSGATTPLPSIVLALIIIVLLAGPLWVTLGVFTGRLVFYYDKDDVALSVVALAVPLISFLAGISTMAVDNAGPWSVAIGFSLLGIGLLVGGYCIVRSVAYSVIDNNGIATGIVIGLTKVAMAWLMVLMMINAWAMIFGNNGKRGSQRGRIAQGVILGGLTTWLFKHLVNGKVVYQANGRSPR